MREVLVTVLTGAAVVALCTREVQKESPAFDAYMGGGPGHVWYLGDPHAAFEFEKCMTEHGRELRPDRRP
jgi:hypothetical protein